MISRLFRSTLLFFASLAVFTSCKKEILPASDTSATYFPFTKGLFRIYDVDSVVHADNDNNNDDSVYTYMYQIMEVLDSSWNDTSGRLVQEVERFYRMDDGSAWNAVGVWTQQLTGLGGYRTEDNVSFHRLSFPISNNVVWNGNATNTLADEYYRYLSFHASEAFNGISFDSVTTVLQIDEDNFVERYYGEEKYVAGVGLVYKKRDALGKRNGQVVRGTEYTMRIIGYGLLQ